VLCTVAALPGAAAREIRAWDGVATSCVDRRATDAPDAAPLTGRLQELGAQHRARILPGALTLVLASRPPPRLSWSTTFKRGLTVVRGLGIFVFMKNHLVPVKSWKPVFKRRNSATLKKGHSIQVNINPTLQKCEHSPVVVKKTQIVFAPAPSRQTQSVSLFYVIDTGSIGSRARIEMGVTYLPFTVSSDAGYADLPLALLGAPVSIETLVKLGSRSLAKQDRD
jgi:hypothetical protein